MRRYQIILIFLLTIIVFTGCSKKNKKFYNDQGQEEKISIIRFDKLLFDKPLPNMDAFLRGLAKDYPEMFQLSLDDPQAMAMIQKFVTDTFLCNAQNMVLRQYADISFLQEGLTEGFAMLKNIYPKTILPKRVFTMIYGPADFNYLFANRTYCGQYNDHMYFTIALDVYSINALKDNPYYKQIPQYMLPTLTKDYIISDFFRMYLFNITCKDIQDVSTKVDCTLLDNIIQEGKYSYIIKQILPNTEDCFILRYTKDQWTWLQKNEKIIWAYIIQNQLLYQKDRSKYMSLIAEGPTSKPLENSPSRVGNYIGYKIVADFMDNNNITIDSLMKINDSQVILKQSSYKPER